MAIIPADEKVFMVDKRTNTIYGGSQSLQDMQQWYTMQDVTDSVRPYKVYTAILTQTGENAPVATVLENTIGDISFTYESAGSYTINSNSLFTVNKTWVQNIILNVALDVVTFNLVNRDNIGIVCSSGDDGLLNTPIEIRIYN
jgi:hypothetical protein